MGEPRTPLLLRVASLAGVAVLAALAVGYGSLGRVGRVGETSHPPAAASTLRDFHGNDRQPVELPVFQSNCVSCHGGTPHFRHPRVAAFLNLHMAELDCAVCHMSADGARYMRFGPDGRVSENPVHPVHLARPGEQGMRPVTGPADGAGIRARPSSCRECHQRGSELLRTPGLYQDFRRLLLENLAVLRRSEVQ